MSRNLLFGSELNVKPFKVNTDILLQSGALWFGRGARLQNEDSNWRNQGAHRS